MKSFTAKIIFIVETILALIVESNAQTQTNGRINANDIIEVKQKHEDTQKLIEILGLQKTAKSTFPKIIAALKPQFPQVPDKFWIEFQSESNLQKCVEFYVETYERHFSHEEIRGMLQFYSTPLGKKIILTMPEVMQESMDMGKEMGIALQEQLEREAPVSNEKPSREAIRRQIILNHGLNPTNGTYHLMGPQSSRNPHLHPNSHHWQISKKINQPLRLLPQTFTIWSNMVRGCVIAEKNPNPMEMGLNSKYTHLMWKRQFLAIFK